MVLMGAHAAAGSSSWVNAGLETVRTITVLKSLGVGVAGGPR